MVPEIAVKKWLARTSLAVVALSLSLGAAESVVRIFYPYARDQVIPGHLFMIDDDLGWKCRPGKTATHDTRYFRVEYATNTLGFRDRLHSTTTSDHRYRILLYGDSLIFGWGVPQNQRFSDRIESESHAYEIFNHAVPGYGLDQEVLSYEREPLHADEAMFFVGASTLSRIHSGFIYLKYKPVFLRQPDGHLMLIRVPKGKNVAIGVLYEVFSPFVLPYFLQTQLGNLQEALQARSSGAHLGAVRSLDAYTFVDGFAEEILRHALRIAQQRNEHMSVLAANLSARDRNGLRRFCDENAVTYVEIGPEISATASTDDASDLIFGRYDKHWNAKANGLIAKQLLSQMKH